ncbi:MAG TPA: hypothetical protein VMW69_01555 [Spirochaetia bacterium]|nr:hypothetical protein [Spirochaetia bacterium]
MKNWRSLLISMGLLVVATSMAWGQSNTTLDKILAGKAASFADAAYLVLTATKKIPDSATLTEAADAVATQNWGIKPSQADQPLTLGTYSFMLMKAFKMHGGIMYTLFPGPRYAARELVYLGDIHGDTSPYRTLSGTEAVNILGSVLNQQEGS